MMTWGKKWGARILFLLLVWAAVVLLFSLDGCASRPAVVPCHPGQHRCETDAECEDEEAFFLDAEEGGQV